jgi:hypothetical protein
VSFACWVCLKHQLKQHTSRSSTCSLLWQTTPLQQDHEYQWRCLMYVPTFFLQAGYGVIFLHRKHSVQPFMKGLPSGQILDVFAYFVDDGKQHLDESASAIVQEVIKPCRLSLLVLFMLQTSHSWRGKQAGGPAESFVMKPEVMRLSCCVWLQLIVGRLWSSELLEAGIRLIVGVVPLQAVTRAKGVYEGKTLLPVVFETLFQYLSYLRAISTKLNRFGAQVAFYMAAAVSDFFIPWSSMVCGQSPQTLNFPAVVVSCGCRINQVMVECMTSPNCWCTHGRLCIWCVYVYLIC